MYLACAFGLRTVIQLRRTGSSGFKGLGVRPGSAEWIAERTELVTAGPFGLVRNPIFSGMLPTSLGLALLVPNAVAGAAFVGLVVALELQTRVVEEPYLLRVHGSTYAGYAARVGRFLPGIGRLRSVGS